MGRPATILFLGANPSDEARLALGREVREIDQRLRASKHRDAFRIEQAWAVHATDLQACLQRHEPAIVHFSGHGDPGGELLLERHDGRAKPVTREALADLFRILGETIRCVVLNACYSETQARTIAEHVDVVIGMKNAVADDAAIAFAGAFYQALGYGQDAQTAFELGRSQIRLAGLPDADVPELLTRPGVDARAVKIADHGKSKAQPAAPAHPSPSAPSGSAPGDPSAFISHGPLDEPFARKLYDALLRNGVRAFLFAEDAEPGEKLHRVARKGINAHERVILLCSRASLDRTGVRNDLEEALAREARDGGASYIIPIRLDGYIDSDEFREENPEIAQVLMDRVIPDFERADRDEARFEAALAKVLRALQKRPQGSPARP